MVDSGPGNAAPGERRVPGAHRVRSAIARRAAALGRAHFGHSGPPPAARRPDRVRAIDRGRVLLRLRRQHAILRRTTWPRSSARWSVWSRSDSRSCARKCRSRRHCTALADDPLKLERIADLGRTRSSPPTLTDLHRSVSRTARAGHLVSQATSSCLHTAGRIGGGDEHRPMLQRIYATAWWKKDDLDAYLHRIEEAKRRDHRTLGAQPRPVPRRTSVSARDSSSGIPGGRPSARRSSNTSESSSCVTGTIWSIPRTSSATRCSRSPGIWRISARNMFGAMDVEGVSYRPKPMNCPGHIAIYQAHPRSYRTCRSATPSSAPSTAHERSGVLHGMLRVRGFTQDDAHVFCTPSRARRRSSASSISCTRCCPCSGTSTASSCRRGPTRHWERPRSGPRRRKCSRACSKARRQAYVIDAGGGAFYGPKLDFKARGCDRGASGRDPTVQLDFNLPERFQLTYTGADNAAHRPIMLHRVLVGSMERFVGGLNRALRRGIPAVAGAGAGPGHPRDRRRRRRRVRRVRWSDRSGHPRTVGPPVGYAQLPDPRGGHDESPVPRGDRKREAADGTVAVTVRGAGEKQHPVPLPADAFVRAVRREIETRSLRLEAGAAAQAAT